VECIRLRFSTGAKYFVRTEKWELVCIKVQVKVYDVYNLYCYINFKINSSKPKIKK
jgi:hypothetical protein